MDSNYIFNAYFSIQINIERIKNSLVELAANNELTLSNLQNLELDFSFLSRISPNSKDKSIYLNLYYFLVDFLIDDIPVDDNIILFFLEKLFNETNFSEMFFEHLSFEEFTELFYLKINFTEVTTQEQLNNIIIFLSSLQERTSDAPTTDLLMYYCHYVLQICQSMTYEQRLECKDCLNIFLDNCDALIALREQLFAESNSHPDVPEDPLIEDNDANEED